MKAIKLFFFDKFKKLLLWLLRPVLDAYLVEVKKEIFDGAGGMTSLRGGLHVHKDAISKLMTQVEVLNLTLKSHEARTRDHFMKHTSWTERVEHKSDKADQDIRSGIDEINLVATKSLAIANKQKARLDELIKRDKDIKDACPVPKPKQVAPPARKLPAYQIWKELGFPYLNGVSRWFECRLLEWECEIDGSDKLFDTAKVDFCMNGGLRDVCDQYVQSRMERKQS